MSNYECLPPSPSPMPTRSWTTATKTELIRWARMDPVTFLRLMLLTPERVRDPMAKVHCDLQQHLSEHRLALVELPRDHGKTTQVCLRVLWELGRNPGLRIKIVCASEAVALERSRFLRQSIEENVVVREVFPHLLKSYPWLAAGFTVQRRPGIIGPSVAAFGLAAASTGTRADLLICDDVVDVKAIHSKANRDRTAEDFFNNLVNLMEPDGRFWGLSTPWHADDLNARLRKNAAYALFRQPVGANCEPVWPEHWPATALTARKAEIGAASFSRGYRLTPVAEDELVIRPEWVGHWEERPASFERIIISVDPAVSVKQSADASALVVLGKAGNAVYCLAAVARRVNAPTLVQWIEQQNSAWQPDEILFESNGAFDAVRELLVRHAQFGPKVVGVKQSRSKLARFSAFSVVVQNRCFLLDPSRGDTELWEEMVSYPFGEHDDLLDAAATGTNRLLSSPGEPRMWMF